MSSILSLSCCHWSVSNVFDRTELKIGDAYQSKQWRIIACSKCHGPNTVLHFEYTHFENIFVGSISWFKNAFMLSCRTEGRCTTMGCIAEQFLVPYYAHPEWSWTGRAVALRLAIECSDLAARRSMGRAGRRVESALPLDRIAAILRRSRWLHEESYVWIPSPKAEV